jgi:hypothetical protein
MDQVHAEGVRHGRSFRHGNLFYNVAPGVGHQPAVRLVQWPSYHQPVLNAVRLDPRMAELLEPLIGCDLKQIINQLHWKPQGSIGDFAWHQDSRFRRPASAYRDLGDLSMGLEGTVLATALLDDALRAAGLDPREAVDVVLQPGDVALWSPYLVHGSGSNRARHQRRLYINGYVRADACDRGEWAFRDGVPVPFGPEPALVHYEELRSRPGPHYP